ncbi:MAG: pilus assembly protein PilM, partial [Patescibacteria group bacterium]
EEAREAVRWEIEQNIPLSINDVYYDWQFVETGPKIGHQDVLVSAMPKKFVDGFVSTLHTCNLSVKGLEVESVAVSRALVKNLASGEPLLMVDLGATRTSFIIFSGSALQFTSSVPVGGNKMIEVIVQALGVEHQEAKRLFYEVGLDAHVDGGKVRTVLEPLVRDLAEQIRNYISFYEGHALHEHHARSDAAGAQGSVAIKKILLCGGVSNLNGLNVYLAMALKIAVETGNPWVNILTAPLREVPGLSYRTSLSYTTALGLALSGIQKAPR